MLYDPFLKSKKTSIKILEYTTKTFRILYRKVVTMAAYGERIILRMSDPLNFHCIFSQYWKFFHSEYDCIQNFVRERIKPSILRSLCPYDLSLKFLLFQKNLKQRNELRLQSTRLLFSKLKTNVYFWFRVHHKKNVLFKM